MKNRYTALLAALCLLLCLNAGATIYYVAPAGTGNGASWAAASGNLRAVMAAAATGDAVWVKQGTYYPAANGAADSSFYLKAGVAVYGGFAGTETALAQRADTSGSLTILSGQLTGGAHSKHIVRCTAATDTLALLDGFTISGGAISMSSSVNIDSIGGAGLYNVGGSPRLRHLVFSGNSVSLSFSNNAGISGYAGGSGMASFGGSPRLRYVRFLNNALSVTGAMGGYGAGAGLLIKGGIPQLDDAQFTGNDAGTVNSFSYGGGMFITSVTLNATNLVLSGNKANNGSGVYINGNTTYPSVVRITNALLVHNTSGITTGGALAVSGIGTTATVVNATFSNNNYYTVSASNGGIDLENCLLDGTIFNGYGSTANITLNHSYTYGNPQYAPFTGANNIIAFTAGAPLLDAARDNYSLLPCSGLIDAGDDAQNNLPTDLAGRPRKHGTIDIGAYEYQRPAILPGIVYVDSSATAASPDGASWAQALPNLQSALAYQCSGTHPAQIWVAKGTYYPTTDTGDRYANFALTSGVAVYGGFSGNETSLTARDSTGAANATILSGELQGDGQENNNSYNVVRAMSVDNTAMLNSFAIEHGKGNDPGQNLYLVSGGGILNVSGDPVLRNLYIRHCRTSFNGGGMYNYNGSPLLERVAFSYDHTGLFGGGFATEGSTTIPGSNSPTLRQVSFDHDSAVFEGGGINLQESPAVITGAVFTNNFAEHYGGGIAANSAQLYLTHALFTGNTTTLDSSLGNSGGGLEFSGPGQSLVITDAVFAGNGATRGGGVIFYGDTGTFTNVTFSSNRCVTNGNAMLLQSGIAYLYNSLVDSVGNGKTDLDEETIYPLTATAAYNMFTGTMPAWLQDGGGNISHTDPLLVDTMADNYALSACSPAINAGSATLRDPSITTDLAGNPRLYNGGLLDLGAYEYQGIPTVLVIAQQPLAQSVAVGGTAVFTVHTGGTAAGYLWQVSTDGGATWVAAGSTDSTLTITSVTAAMNGSLYRCLLGSSCGGTTTSAAVPLTVLQLGIAAIWGNAAAVIYPNPAGSTTTLQISCNTAAAAVITLNDITGKEVAVKKVALKAGSNQVPLSLEGLAKGIYPVHIVVTDSNMEYQLVLKMVKQ